MRNYRLRERRLALGLSQRELGCIAGFIPSSAQSRVSCVERYNRRGHPISENDLNKIRRALIWVESEPRRLREWHRQEQMERCEIAAILAAPRCQESESRLIERLVDLLCDGREEDFDQLVGNVPELAAFAGDIYLGLCAPAHAT